MNELLQRRLVGALVLFVAAFGLASLLPDAPAPVRPEGVQVVTYDLNAGQAPAESPTPKASAAPPAGTVVAPPQPRTAVQLQESLSLSSTQSWYVQVGSFENQANARSVLTRLHQMDSPVSIQPVQVGKTLWYRVRVGPYPAEAPAQKSLDAIRKKGFNGARLVRPDSS